MVIRHDGYRGRRAAAFSAALMLAACAGQRAPLPPPIDVENNGRVEPRSSAPVGAADPLADELDAFCAAVARRAGVASVACFPLAQHDAPDSSPAVTALGEDLAERVARGLEEHGFDGWVLDARELALRVADTNAEVSVLHSEVAVARHGDRMGVDAVVFGSIERRDAGRRETRLAVELWAWDVATDRTIASATGAYASTDVGSRTAFDLAGRASRRWSAGGAWAPVEPAADLASELRTAARTAMKRAARELDLSRYRIIYVPPANSAELVGRLAEVQSALLALQRAKDDHAAALRDGRAPPDGPLTIGGVAYSGLQEAEDAVIARFEELRGSEVFQFCAEVSEVLIEELLAYVTDEQVKRDLGFTRLSDNPLMKAGAWIAADSLARNRASRLQLADEGIELVLAPKLVRTAKSYRLRVSALDLVEQDYAYTTAERIDARFADALAAEFQERVEAPGR